MYDGTAFHRSSSCSTIKKVSEWHICWDVVERDIMAGRCIVYSFGIAGDDPFTNYMSKAGCQVVSCHSFDFVARFPFMFFIN